MTTRARARHRHRHAASGGSAHGDPARIRALCAHFERHIGRATHVVHERRSHVVHVDVHAIPPQPKHPYITLFTTGMSERPMAGVPCDCCPSRLELMMTLPPSWPLPRLECCDDHRRRGVRRRRRPGPKRRADAPTWPFQVLRDLASYPHRAQTWLGYGHTLQEDDPPSPYARDTRFCGAILLPSLLAPPAIHRAVGADGEPIEVLAVYPLYAEELGLKVRHGVDALLALLDAGGVTDRVQPDRVNVGLADPAASADAVLPGRRS